MDTFFDIWIQHATVMDGKASAQIQLIQMDLNIVHLRGAIKMVFRKKLGIWPNKGGGGLTDAQVFVENSQNQICIGKWPEM